MFKSSEDKALGMNRKISRRDFVNGVAVAVGGAALSSALPGHSAVAQGSSAPPRPEYQTGLRGQYEGSQAVAHAQREGPLDLSGTRATGEKYDLVVVGAGISGLAAALHYRQIAGPRATVLLIDPLDDFGGHAKRNEFTVNKKRLIGYGGSQSMQTPSYFSPAVNRILSDVGIEPKKFEGYYDGTWAEKRGLESATMFTRESWGVDKLVKRSGKASEWVPKTPLSSRAQADLIALLEKPADYLAGKTRLAKLEQLSRTTYKDFLLEVAKVDPQLVQYYQGSTEGYFGVGIDATSCIDAWGNGNPGFSGMDLGDQPYRTASPSGRLALTDPDPYIYHFPDGNASVARALVARLIPGALGGRSMEQQVLERVNYAQLDKGGQAVRLRLNSTGVRVQHLGDASSASEVEITYAGPNGLESVKAGHVVMACWHRSLPYLMPELGEAQKAALNDMQKVPLMYTNVVLRNWKAFEALKVDGFSAPGYFWRNVEMDFPVSMGKYQFAQNPSDPMILHLPKVMTSPGESSRSQAVNGRRKLMNLSFEEMERSIRSLLGRALSSGGFDPARDIAAITVNRWAHGYAYEYMRPWDKFWPDGPLPIETARAKLGRVAIAGSDSGSYAYMHSAVDQGVRAVRELLGSNPDAPAFSSFPGPPLEKLKLVGG